jgi:Spy/CpxP family protein refolding chaperone
MKKLFRYALPIIALVISAPVLAQGGPQGPPPGGPGGQGGPGQQMQGPPPDLVLKEALGFTDEQLTALRTLGETRRTAAEALQTQLMTAQRALGDALKAANPDPANIGTLFLRVDSLQKQFKAIDDAFKTGFSNLLTAQQKEKVTAIQAIEQQLKAAGALHQLGAI